MQTSNKGKAQKNVSSTAASNSSGLQESQLMKLFEHGIKDIYWAEKTLTKAIPKMIRNASSTELVNALENHLEETQNQVSRIEQIFEILGKKAVGQKCPAMEGLIQEGQEIMEESEDGPMCDAAIIGAGQKVEHYEIATYGTLRQFAETLGLTDAVQLLEETLDEEKNADQTLTEIAVASINVEASELEEGESEEESEPQSRASSASRSKSAKTTNHGKNSNKSSNSRNNKKGKTSTSNRG